MDYVSFKISKHAWVYISILIFIIIVFFPFIPFISFSLIFILLFIIYFFRDPDRVIPDNNKLILSPADGIVTSIEKSELPIETSLDYHEYNKISIFLSVFDVHVNRIPAFGKIISCDYIPGKFINATNDKSSEDNERNIITLKMNNKQSIIFVQIAGLIARRIICDLKLNQEVNMGERFGIIKFGSRVDIYLPKELDIYVFKGQKLIAGQTIISKLNNN